MEAVEGQLEPPFVFEVERYAQDDSFADALEAHAKDAARASPVPLGWNQWQSQAHAISAFYPTEKPPKNGPGSLTVLRQAVNLTVYGADWQRRIVQDNKARRDRELAAFDRVEAARRQAEEERVEGERRAGVTVEQGTGEGALAGTAVRAQVACDS